jgi:intein-encoded DNA endonuclease-like protein
MPRILNCVQHAQLQKDYATGNFTHATLKKKYKVSSIHRYLNLLPSASAQTTDKDLRHDYFTVIDSEAKAYFLGFILGDGNLAKTRKCITINIHSRDEEIIDKFIAEVNTHNKKQYRHDRSMVIIHVVSNFMWEDLVRLGLTPNKSLTVKFPIVPEHLRRHLVRGIFDADGTITTSSNNKSHMAVNISGTLDVVTNCRKEIGFIEDNGIYKVGNIYRFQKGGVHKVQKFYNYLYKDATIYLSRKKVRFEELLNS